MKKPRTRVQIGDQLFGYRDGFRQYSRELHLLVPRLVGFAADDAANHLHEAFEISKDEQFQLRKQTGVSIEPAVETFVAMCSQVARHLLQFASVPSFEADLVFASEPASLRAGQASVSMFVAAQANMSNRLLGEAYGLGLRIVTEFTKPAYKRQALADLTHQATANLVRYAKSVGRGGFSTKSILKAAFERDIPFLHLGWGYYQLGMGANSKVFIKSATNNDSLQGAHLSGNKLTCIQYLKSASVPVPASFLVRDVVHAKQVAEQIGYPVVVKPSNRDRGEGVSVDLESPKEVEGAYNRAGEWSNSILLEERISGICHRLLIFKDELVFAFARHPKSVVGDGELSVKELNDKVRSGEAKKAKHLRKKTVELDDLAISCLQRHGYDTDTILDEDQIAHLRPHLSEIWGGHDEILTDRVHPANAELARRVARLLELETAGVDLITTDIGRPWYETGAAINEVNYKPQVGENTAKACMEISFSSGTGEIPVECFVGDAEALSAAAMRQAELGSQGVDAFLTSHKYTTDHENNEIHLKDMDNLFGRSELLIRDRRVERLILVVQTDELLTKGLPVREFSDVAIVNEAITPSNSRGAAIDAETFQRLKIMLQGRVTVQD